MKIPRSALKAVAVAMPRNDFRNYLNGMLIECSGSTVRLVASDAHRMHIMDIEQDEPCPVLPENVIMPCEMVEWALKHSRRHEVVEISIVKDEPNDGGEHQFKIEIRTQRGSMDSVLIAERYYPDYLSVIQRRTTGKMAQFNPRLVAQSFEAILELSGTAESLFSIDLQHNGVGAALMCYGRFAALIMPWYPEKFHIDPRLAERLT